MTEIINNFNKELNINNEVENARYSNLLQEVVEELVGKKLLRKEYESNWQGFVDVDVLLTDGRVFSYKYYYGSCSGCDEWESEMYTDLEIKNIMLKEATIFNNLIDYNKWREKVNKENNDN